MVHRLAPARPPRADGANTVSFDGCTWKREVPVFGSMPSSSRLRALLLIAGLGLATLACSLPKLAPAEMPDDGAPVSVSQEAAVRFVTKIVGLGQQASASRVVSFTVTQEEVTSALAYATELASYAQGGPVFEGLAGLQMDDLPMDQLPPEARRFRQLADSLGSAASNQQEGRFWLDLRLQVEEPQVYFKSDGRMILRGYGRLARWRQPMRVVIAPRAEQSEIELDFVEGQLGSIPLPELLFDPLGELIGQALLAGEDYASIDRLEVDEGTLSFSGELQLPLDP